MANALLTGTSQIQFTVDWLVKHEFLERPEVRKSRSLILTEKGQAALDANQVDVQPHRRNRKADSELIKPITPAAEAQPPKFPPTDVRTFNVP